MKLTQPLSALLAGCSLIACGSDPTIIREDEEATAIGAVDPEVPDYGPGVPFGPPEAIFERNHIVEVQVEIEAADWDALRFEGMSIGEVAFPSNENGVRVVPEYTEFSARVTVDGIPHENVAVRKKGYIGSLSSFRPSLKLHFSRFFEEELATGMKRMTLNNDRQDPSHARQCLTYDLFERVGLPSPRCNFAHVVVNGQDLGIYTHLEGIKKPMLARYFDDTDGNLYEGELSDFEEGTADSLEKKTNEDEDDWADVEAVISALALEDDGEMLTALEQVVDMDRFFDFWALETLVGHWDGYAGNSNNYRAYRDPTTGKFVFIPWGADQSFVGVNPNSPLPYLDTVYANGAISNRLYVVPAQRERFRSRLGELNDELWDVPSLLQQVDDLGLLAWDADLANLEELRSYIRVRGETLRESLQQPAPDWVDEPEQPPVDDCEGMALPLSGRFSSLWREQPNFGLGQVAQLEPQSEASLELDGRFTGAEFKSVAAETSQAADSRVHRRGLLFQEFLDDNGRVWFLQMGHRLENVKPGFQRFHSIESNGFIGMLDTQSGNFQNIALVGGGGVHFDEVDLREGQPVTGTVEATAYLFQCIDTAIEASEQARAALAAQAEQPPGSP